MTGLGVDEHVWQHASARRITQFVTGITDLTPGRPARLLEVLPGRTGMVYASWLAARGQDWKDRVSFAALDPFRGYATALACELPGAVRVLDAIHVVKLGSASPARYAAGSSSRRGGGAGTKATRCMRHGGR